MGLKGKASAGSGDFEQAPEGTHNAVCCRVVDMGTQEGHYGPKRRVQLGFEIDEMRQDGTRFMSFGHYTLSLHPKATLRKTLEAWRGRAYAEGEDIDLAGLVGKGCLLSLVKNETGEYTNISSISALPKGMLTLEPAGDLILFDCDEPDPAQLEKLGERMQDKIIATREYQEAITGRRAPAQPVTAYGKAGPDPATHAPAGDRVPGADEDFSDDIPF